MRRPRPRPRPAGLGFPLLLLAVDRPRLAESRFALKLAVGTLEVSCGFSCALPDDARISSRKRLRDCIFGIRERFLYAKLGVVSSKYQEARQW